MRSISLYVLSAFVLLAIFCSTSTGHQLSQKHEQSLSDILSSPNNLLPREKRDIENFDEAYPTGTGSDAQEEPGFWDRVVQVALKLFSKFMEWINSP